MWCRNFALHLHQQNTTDTHNGQTYIQWPVTHRTDTPPTDTPPTYTQKTNNTHEQEKQAYSQQKGLQMFAAQSKEEADK